MTKVNLDKSVADLDAAAKKLMAEVDRLRAANTELLTVLHIVHKHLRASNLTADRKILAVLEKVFAPEPGQVRHA